MSFFLSAVQFQRKWNSKKSKGLRSGGERKSGAKRSSECVETKRERGWLVVITCERGWICPSCMERRELPRPLYPTSSFSRFVRELELDQMIQIRSERKCRERESEDWRGKSNLDFFFVRERFGGAGLGSGAEGCTVGVPIFAMWCSCFSFKKIKIK